jgi:hypothetical protein
MKIIFAIFFLFSLSTLLGQEVEIKGYAPAYVDKKVQILGIQDYFSNKDTLLAETNVKKDSTFSVKFFLSKTQKIIIKPHKNRGFIYTEPNRTYTLFLPEKDEFNAYNPQGNEIQISFYKLDSSDLNMKILEFDNLVTNFIAKNYKRKNITTPIFAGILDTFKTEVQKFYERDTSFFLKTYIKYSIASLDDINYVGYKNRYEKYEFYINNNPIIYNNELYMSYIELFYKKLLGRYPTELNTKIYKSILHSSPSMLSNTLSEDVTLKNPKLRELIMIRALSEVYYGSEYPKANIITILDSIQRKPLFYDNKIVAKNILFRLTQLSSGMKAPDFFLGMNKTDSFSLKSFNGKYLYIQFVDLSLEESQKHIEILKPMYAKYKSQIEFLTIVDETTPLTKKQQAYFQQIPWKKIIVPSTNDVYSKYKIKSYPDYIFLDDQGMIYQYPALKPVPNGDLETVEKTLYTVKRRIETEKANIEKNSIDNIYGDD